MVVVLGREGYVIITVVLHHDRNSQPAQNSRVRRSPVPEEAKPNATNMKSRALVETLEAKRFCYGRTYKGPCGVLHFAVIRKNGQVFALWVLP